MAPAAVSARSRELIQEMSRHDSPFSTNDDGMHDRDGSVVLMAPNMDNHQQSLTGSTMLAQNGEYVHSGPAHARLALDGHGGRGPIRRARSATTVEAAPYPQHKSHSCPIPSCGRFFKRLEHLKRHDLAFEAANEPDYRHKRTHDSHHNQSQSQSATMIPTNSPKYLAVPDQEEQENQEGEGNDWASTVEGEGSSDNSRAMMPPTSSGPVSSATNDNGTSTAENVIANNISFVSASSSPVIHASQVNGAGLLTSHGITPQLLRQHI
ncbi:homeodomain transcription factor ste12 [Ascosphaera aggregata]|nr:homeodomain transcription factor ste12 [Ascosphaera aggregata]